MGPVGEYTLIRLLEKKIPLQNIIIRDPRFDKLLNQSGVRNQIFRISESGFDTIENPIIADIGSNNFFRSKGYTPLPPLNYGDIKSYSTFAESDKSNINFSVSIYDLQIFFLDKISHLIKNFYREIINKVYSDMLNSKFPDEDDRRKFIYSLHDRFYTSKYNYLYIFICMQLFWHYDTIIGSLAGKFKYHLLNLYKFTIQEQIYDIKVVVWNKDTLLDDLIHIVENESKFISDILYYDDTFETTNNFFIFGDISKNIIIVSKYIAYKHDVNVETRISRKRKLESLLLSERTKQYYYHKFFCHGANDANMKELDFYKNIYPNELTKRNIMEDSHINVRDKNIIENNSYAITITFQDEQLRTFLHSSKDYPRHYRNTTPQHFFRWFPSIEINTPHYLGLIVNESDYNNFIRIMGTSPKIKVNGSNSDNFTWTDDKLGTLKIISVDRDKSISDISDINNEYNRLIKYILDILKSLYPFDQPGQTLNDEYNFNLSLFPLTYKKRNFEHYYHDENTSIIFCGDALQNVHFFSGSGVNNGLTLVKYLFESNTINNIKYISSLTEQRRWRVNESGVLPSIKEFQQLIRNNTNETRTWLENILTIPLPNLPVYPNRDPRINEYSQHNQKILWE